MSKPDPFAWMGEEETTAPPTKAEDLADLKDLIQLNFQMYMDVPSYNLLGKLTKQMERYENLFMEVSGLDDADREFKRDKELAGTFAELDLWIKRNWKEVEAHEFNLTRHIRGIVVEEDDDGTDC